MNWEQGVKRSFILIYIIWVCYSAQNFVYDFFLDEDFKDCIEIGDVSTAELAACNFYRGADDYPSSARLEDLDTCTMRNLYHEECGDRIISNYFEDVDNSIYFGLFLGVILKFILAPFIFLRIILWALKGWTN